MLANFKNYPFDTKVLKKWIDSYDFIVPVLHEEQVGERLIVSIYANDYLELLRRAGVAPLLCCPQCGEKNKYKDGPFIRKGFTEKLRQIWKCKLCGKKTTTLKI